MFDLLDLLQGKTDKVFTGTWYPKRPNNVYDEHADFDYEMVDPTERHYQTLLGNVINNDGATLTIKTNDDMGWKVGQFAALQDGNFYNVLSCSIDYQSASREAFRFLKDAVGVEFVLRLLQVDNPWKYNG